VTRNPVRAVGVDVGTSSLKAVRIRTERHRASVEAVAVRQYARSGLPTRDPAMWVRAARGAIAELVDGGPIDAVGYTGQMHALVPIVDGVARGPARLWLDYEGQQDLEGFCRSHPELSLLERTGNIGLPDFTLAKWLRWRGQDPLLAARVERLPSAKDHVRASLTPSSDPVTDINEASGTQMYDPFGRSWDAAIVSAAAIPPAALPRVVEPTTVVGSTRWRSSSTQRVPVVAGTGDQAAALRGVGAMAGQASLSMGTSGVLCVPWSTQGLPPGWDGNWHLFPVTMDGSFVVIATIPALAGSLQWVARVLGIDLAGLARLANTVKTARGVRFFPYLGGSGAPHPDVSQRGQLRGLAQGTTAADLARAALEGVANELALLVEETRGQGVEVDEVVLSGGLAALDPLASLIGGRMGLAAWRSSVSEASAVGAALTALDGVGRGGAAADRARVTVRRADRADVDEEWRRERESILSASPSKH
jgi:sugar (pentulose or hexulose) kinase